MKRSVDESGRIFSFPAPFKGPVRKTLFLPVQGILEKVLLLNRLEEIYREIGESTQTTQFLHRALEVLGVEYEVSEKDLACVPQTGPLLVVANHPFGGVEGLILGSLLLGIRADTKIMANCLLGRIPEMRDILLCVDLFNAKLSVRRNLKPLREGMTWLNDGHALAVFPAGSVSRLNFRERKAVDTEWHGSIGRIIRKSKAQVLPVFFEGGNTVLFHLAGMLHPKLRTALLPHELLNKGNKTIKVSIGNVIPFRRLDCFESDGKLMDYLRIRTYALKFRRDEAAKKEASMSVEKCPKFVRETTTTTPRPGAGAVREVENLPPSQVLLQSEGYAVCHAKAHQIPNLLYEIGRLREITFRRTGEGTGKEIDLDRFDLYYTHLFLWNTEKREVVGAYRLGQADLILQRFAAKGLYTSTLFRYKDGFLQSIESGIELGRSFVREEYQKLYAPLLLLWKGIGHFIARNPQYTILFGPVTISDTYSELSKQLMVSYLTINHYAPDLARFIRPRNPIRRQSLKRVGLRSAAGLPADIDHLSSLVADIEADRKGIPVLLRQYVKLGGRIMGFNIDPSFRNGLDGLILVDLLKCDRRVLDRYMGKQGCTDFFRFHEERLQRRMAS